jgi:hypothetical protein
MTSPLAPDASLPLFSCSALPERSVYWLWPYRLAYGKLAIFDGDPGLGKSLVALDIAAAVTTGRPFPDGAPAAEPSNVLVLSGEDSTLDTVIPRLRALGADLSRVFVFHSDDDDDSFVSIPGSLDLLHRALLRTRARLLILDPIVSFLDKGVNINNDQSVRRGLKPMRRLAHQHRCCTLFVRNLNKHVRVSTIYRGGGSIGIVGFCRSAWIFAPDPDQPADRRIMAQAKNNLAALQPSLVYALGTPGPGVPSPVSWVGTSPLTAADLLEPFRQADRRPSPRDLGVELLLDALKDGPQTTQELWKMLDEHGVPRSAMPGIRAQLRIRSRRIGADACTLTYWLLPGQELPAHPPPKSIDDELEPWIAPLRDRYPQPTPLDDL